jgi:endonuclease/exonuclease/phosphatase family metal-dependent hydrolase
VNFRSAFGVLFFALAATASAAPILSEPFDYTNGPLVTVSAGKWDTHSGTGGQIEVISNRIALIEGASEDVNALLSAQTNVFTSGALYASFTVHFTNLPSASGDYFAHFKSSSSTGFRGKVFATRLGAAAGSYRIGLANLSNAPNAILNRDLILNTDYTILTRLVLSNAQSTLWINPSSETDSGVTDTNSTATLGITAFAFRQDTGIGTLFVDDLLVGTNFNDVLKVTPPRILVQPTSRTVTEGATTTFSVAATGTTPLTYQWQFDGGEITGATNATLTLTNVTLAHRGVYLVTVANPVDTTNSGPANLAVNPLNPFGSSAAFSLVHYNVKGNFAPDWTTNAPQVQAIARQLLYLQPDIIVLNEIPNSLRGEMTNWMKAFFQGYNLAVTSGTDGALRSGVISRFSIIRSNSWLDGASLTNFGYEGSFTRDLFEAVIAVPNFTQPLHVFTTHLKSGQGTDESARRAAECRAISNYFANSFLTTNAAHPYLLTGDMNEDIARPPSSNPKSIQTLISAPTGLQLTMPINPYSNNELTHSIQSTNGLSHRYDYILPCGMLVSNIASSEVFRTDLLPAPAPPLQTNDDVIASDHLPVLMVFNNPYSSLSSIFRFTSVALSNQTLVLQWQSAAGHSYALQSSSNLVNWTMLVTNLTSSNTTLSFTTNISGPHRFFRATRSP